VLVQSDRAREGPLPPRVFSPCFDPARQNPAGAPRLVTLVYC